MYPHPTIPRNLALYALNDWTLSQSSLPSGHLESPFDFMETLSLRKLLDVMPKYYEEAKEDIREFQLFMQKFKLFLIDGVPVDYQSSTRAQGQDRAILSLRNPPGEQLYTATLVIQTQEVNYDEGQYYEVDLRRIVRVTKSLADSLQEEKSLHHLMTKKEKKRFILIDTYDRKQLQFFAKTTKDANLILCGLKLLIERLLRENIRKG